MKPLNTVNRFSLSILLVLVGLLLGSNLVHAANPLALNASVQHADAVALPTDIDDTTALDKQDAVGWTALMYATKAGDTEQVEALLKAGASPDIGDRLARTPLELATKAPLGITRLLIKAGADVDIRNAGGIPVIMTAAGQGRMDVVKTLLAAGARLDFKDYQGNTIMDWAQRGGNAELAAFLKPRFDKAATEANTESGEDFIEEMFADAVHPDWFILSYLDLDEDLNDALQKGKQGLMVYVGLKRCSYCQAFMENTLAKPDIANRVQRLFDSVGLDIFSNDEMLDPTGKSYTVASFVTAKKANYSPTMIFYGKEGRQLLKIVGYYPPEKFRLVLDYLEGEHYERERLYTYITRHTSDTGQARAELQKDELFPNTTFTLDRKSEPANRPLVVLFEQPDCVACDRFHQRVLTDKAIRRLLKRFDAVQLDATDATTAVVTPGGSRTAPRDWYTRLGLSYSPAMVFYDEAGNEITRLDSETKRWRVEGTLQLILEKGYTKDTQVQRWRRDKAVEFYQMQQPES
ncbi:MULTISPECIES: thioredoxin fold domain-containing protein [unclassified Thiocapsa]|uniref:thioredoxin fold domain-containing protein n=1 Tax=unclassified Thiocapsa TaxID=2641286 RepID=UPI0035ADE24A